MEMLNVKTRPLSLATPLSCLTKSGGMNIIKFDFHKGRFDNKRFRGIR
jgi:hypothetical protein